ncbi:MAG: beta-ketoacyl synthase N-terminal-like domain-containing protein [Exilibacterium sp.]
MDKFSSAVGESAFDIDVNTPFQELGVDSFIVIQLLSDLENIFGELPKTLLFEKHCISELSRYFVEEHYDTLCDMFSINDVEVLVEKVSLEAPEKESVIETVSKNATYYSNTTDVEPLPVQELINNDSGENFRRKTEEYLLKILSEATGALRIEVNTHFQDLEVDSYIALKVINDLGKLFGELPKTLLFENYCVSDLATYFIKEHKETLAGILSKSKNKKVNISEDTTTTYGIEKNEIFNHNKYSEYVKETVLTPKVVGECFQETQIFLQDETIIEAVNELNDKYGAESTALGRANFAPHIFVGSSLTGFFYCNEKDQYLVAFGYIGPDHSLSININEIENYAKSKNKDLYFIDQENVLNLREKEYLTLPFAVLQRIENIRSFTTNGKSKRKLRYMISKFKQSGKTLTEEYSVGSDQRIDNYIIEIIDSWSEQKVMVNPYIKRVKSDIKNKQLSPNYRVFLTWCDNNLENVIIISSMKSHNGYLMDCEFYTNDMIKGGLEFAIVSIIEILREEGCDMFSLGITWGAKVEDKGNPDIKSRKTLLELMERNIFDGSGNLQFKNKFQPNNKQIYLLKPKSLAKDRVLDIILTIANSDHPSSDSGVGLEKSLDIQKTKAEASISLRKAQLEAAGYNPANIPAADVEKDLSTDSWAKLDYSWAQSPKPLEDVSLERLEGTIRRLLPFAFFTFTHSGDEAERCFWSSLQFAGKRVLQNRMFPTFIYNTLKAGYKPEEISSCNSENQSLIDLQKLQIELEQDFSNIAAVCVELATNANGGQVVPVTHLRQLKKLLSQHPGIPLIIDATRLLDNCIMQTADPDEYVSIVHETCSFADVLTISLSKNFMVSLGGVVACSNYALAKRMDDYAKTNNLVLSGRDISSINIRLGQTEFLFENVRKRQEQTRCLQKAFDNAGVCFHKPASDWSVLIDVQSMDAFKTQPNSLASFLNDLYLHTGIRAGIHSPGLGPNPPFNGMLRVVIPVGMPDASAKKITQSITRLKDSNIPSGVLELASQPNEFGGHVKARYNYKEKSKNTNTPSFSNIDSTVCKKAKENSTDIAIVGLSGRYPKANTMEEFWDNLKQGRDCVEEKSLARWDERLPSDHSDIPQTRWGGFIDNVDKFDAMFFNIAPKEAALLDPQERLFMQIAWETLEDAGYTPESLVEMDPSRRVGVYVAAVWQLYQMLGAEQTEIGNLQTPNSLLWSIANRVSSFMNFSGPSMAVDTACSGSLASIYLACQAIQNGECSAAIAGGVNLDLHDSKWLLTRASGFLSPDGRCKAFAQGANGYVAGEGIGAILLKPLSQAIEDRDNIYGIIKACSFNHGGRASGYSVPNPNAQGEMIADAIVKSQIDARTINYIETHGTGTQLGDPIEIRGLTSAYSRYTSDFNFCALGSVKSNIGHLEAAAGIAGTNRRRTRPCAVVICPGSASEFVNVSVTNFFKLPQNRPLPAALSPRTGRIRNRL